MEKTSNLPVVADSSTDCVVDDVPSETLSETEILADQMGEKPGSADNEELYFGWVFGRGSPKFVFAHQIARIIPPIYTVCWTVGNWYYYKYEHSIKSINWFNTRYAQLTCWTTTFIAIYFCLAASLPLARHRYKSIPHWMLRGCSFFLYLASSLMCVVLPVFWIAVHTGEESPLETFMETHEHLFMALAIFAEFLFTRVPIYPRDAFICIGIAIEYLQVNAITVLARGEPVYKMLTWKEGKSFAVAGGLLVYYIVCLALKVVYRRWQERNLNWRTLTNCVRRKDTAIGGQ